MHRFAGRLGRFARARRLLTQSPECLDPFCDWVVGVILLAAGLLELANLVAGLPKHRVDVACCRLLCSNRKKGGHETQQTREREARTSHTGFLVTFSFK